MNKTLKKFVSATVAGVMLVSAALAMSACGENSTGGESKGGEIFIGGTGPLTGSASSYGISVKQGAELAVKEINAAGGFNGITIKFEIRDDEAGEEKAVSGYSSLMDAGMQLSIGSVTSGSCEAFAQKALADNLFFMTPSASAANVIADRPNAFRVCFGDPDQGILAARELVKTYSNIGVIYDTSDDYSSGIFKAFEEEMKNLGKTFTVQSFDADHKTDFSTQVEQLKSCDVIFLPIYYTEAGLIAKTCVSKNIASPLFGCDGLDGVAGQVDETVTNQIQYITPFDVNSTEAKVSAFVAAYKEAYGIEPDQFAADGYDAIYALVEGMKAAGIDSADITPADLCEKMIAAITADSFEYAGATGAMKWDASGACTKTPQIVTLGK